jgi:hypothetical protein
MLRRSVLLGGLLTLVSGVSCSCCTTRASAQELDVGCALSNDRSMKLFQNERRSGFGIVSHSGNREFDVRAASVLSQLSQLLSVTPGFVYFTIMSHNAYATKYELFPKTDGTVLFGRDLLFQIMQKNDPLPIFDGICAHEFAHIFQYKKGLNLHAGQRNVKRTELHADFIAGYCAGRNRLRDRNYNAAVVAMEHESFGDYGFQDRDHHGTPNERAAAVVKGFEAGFVDKLDASAAIERSIRYVSNIR